jgi:hypothetical protein
MTSCALAFAGGEMDDHYLGMICLSFHEHRSVGSAAGRA